MADTDFTVIRHGQTAENLKGILQGHLNTPLDSVGRLQAFNAAERLADEKFDFIFCSDLLRVKETAAIIGEKLHLSPVFQPELREWHLGELEGQECSSLWERYPEVMNAFKFDDGQDVQVPGGETKYQFFSRISGYLDFLAENCSGKRILIITHGGVMRAIFRHIAGSPRKGCMIPPTDNASYSRFFRRGEYWQLSCWNDVSHLKNTPHRESVTF